MSMMLIVEVFQEMGRKIFILRCPSDSSHFKKNTGRSSQKELNVPHVAFVGNTTKLCY